MKTNEELVAMIKAGDDEAVCKLWQQCYGFVRLQAIRYSRSMENRPGFDLEDLVQGGYFAMCKAVDIYDAGRGAFLPVLNVCLKTVFSEIAGYRTSAQRKEPLNTASSLDAPIGNDEGNELVLADMIPCEEEGFEEVEEAMYKESVSETVTEALQSLPERQNKAVTAHYLEGRTQGEIGAFMNVSTSRAGRIIKDGLNNLRKGDYASRLAELLWGEMNFYKHTGYTAWRESGCSVQEWLVIWKDREEKKHGLRKSNDARVRYCMEILGMDRGQAERLFPV